MQINLDPTRWMVSFVGFVVDWMLTREWKRIALNSIPLMLLATVGVLVFAGSRIDKHKLANRYLALGEKEVADWEQSWAPSKSANGDSEQPTPIADKDKKELSRFAEVLFRRVELLEPNDRSRFIIAVTMAQRGATAQAEKLFSKLAPANRPGYAPAHAWVAQNILQQMLKNPSDSLDAKQVSHHLKEAVKWDRVPESLLLVGSELFRSLQDRDSSLALLKKAAEVNPANSLFLAQRSKSENPVLAANALAQAESYFREKLERDPNDLKSRMGLVQTLFTQGNLPEAEQVIRAGMQIEPSPELTRGLSEVYRLQFRSSLVLNGDTLSGDIQMLDTAMRTDPTNPLVVEEIAYLARVNGKSPGDELIKKLQQFLAEGKATVVTHAWISDLYLMQKNYKQALPYLEQVVSRSPATAQYLNNLAFVIDEVAPERREEALKFAQRAVQIGAAQNETSTADYFDTLAKVLLGLKRPTEAITALESAIERQPRRLDFHENIASLYEAAGNAQMAEQHRGIVQRLAEAQAIAEKAQAEAEAAQALAAATVPTPGIAASGVTAPETTATDVTAPDASVPITEESPKDAPSREEGQIEK